MKKITVFSKRTKMHTILLPVNFFTAIILLTFYSTVGYAQNTIVPGNQSIPRQTVPVSGYLPPQTDQQQPIRPQTLQTAPKSIQQNGVTVYQQHPNQPNTANPYQPAPAPQGFWTAQPPISPSGTENRTTTPGYGSPYPTGPIRVAANQPEGQQATGAVYGLPPNPNPTPPPQPQPVYYATHPGQPTAVQPERSRVHIGRSEPEYRAQPFFLTPQEQRELDEFLVRWEKYSETIKNYEVQFRRHEYELVKTEAMPNGGMALKRSTFGNFKYCASPSRFSYHVEGDLVRDPETGKGLKVYGKDDPTVSQEKIIINEKAFYQFDFNGKKVVQINLPPEVVNSGIAKSPLPLIFGAKAEDMKKRFSMKIVTPANVRDSELWLQVRPLTLEDQQEFRELEIRLDKKLQANAITRSETNGINVSRYQLFDVKINSIFNFGAWIRDHFVASIPRDWTHEVLDWAEESPGTATAGPPNPNPAPPNRSVAEPYRPPNPQPPRNEIPLYQPRN